MTALLAVSAASTTSSAKATELLGFNLPHAKDVLTAQSLVAEADSLNNLVPERKGVDLVYLFVHVTDLAPGLRGTGTEVATEDNRPLNGVAGYSLYGLGRITCPQANPSEFPLVWTKVRDNRGAVNTLRSYYSLLQAHPRDVEVLHSKELKQLRRVLSLQHELSSDAGPHTSPIATVRSRLRTTALRRWLFSDELPEVSMAFVGFLGDKVHAYAIELSSDSWQPPMIHLYSEDVVVMDQLVSIARGTTLPFRLLVELEVVPALELREHHLVEQLAASLTVGCTTSDNYMVRTRPTSFAVHLHGIELAGSLPQDAINCDSVQVQVDGSILKPVESGSVLSKLPIKGEAGAGATKLMKLPLRSPGDSLYFNQFNLGTADAKFLLGFLDSLGAGHSVNVHSLSALDPSDLLGHVSAAPPRKRQAMMEAASTASDVGAYLLTQLDQVTLAITHLVAVETPPRSILITVGRPRTPRRKNTLDVALGKLLAEWLSRRHPLIPISTGTVEVDGVGPLLIRIVLEPTA